MLGISRLGGIGVALVTGFVIDKLNLRKGLWLITFITGIFTVLMGVVSVKYVGLILFLQAVVVTGFFPLGFVAIARMFGRETRSMATGLILTLSIVFGAGGIPYLLGLSGDLVSFKFGLLILGILVCLSSILALSLKELQ
jgi:MFS family permease